MDLLTLLIVILIVAWLGGYVFLPALGGLIHLLLVIVLIIVVVRLIQGRQVL
jgi:uncharacterized protein DUF5670